jgi:hypothetical protein
MHSPKPRREDIPQRRHRTPPGPVPTLGELQEGTPWLWAVCDGLDAAASPVCTARLWLLHHS